MSFFSKILGPKVDYAELVHNGAKVIDVRTVGEFATGNAEVSQNLPLQDIDRWKKQFKKGEKVIVVCRSGARAGSAKRILESQGCEVYNAGAWQNLR